MSCVHITILVLGLNSCSLWLSSTPCCHTESLWSSTRQLGSSHSEDPTHGQ